jgi:rare lipoprotein A
MFRRAGFLLALLLAALSFSAPSSALATDSAPLMPEASARSGLKLSSPAALAAGRFKFDGEPEAAEDEPAADVAPRPIHNVDKSEYALPTTLPGSGSQFREKGVASWYGKMFHGRKTSSGDTYDMYAMTAAHPSLPIPSYVRVTNLNNGRSAVVRVNDRGPFHPGRIIDLSYAAAYKLGYTDQGQANVEVALVLPEDVALVHPARPIPPVRKARPALQPTIAAARQQAAPAAAPAEVPRPMQPELPVVASVQPAVVPVALATVAAAGGKQPERGGSQVFCSWGPSRRCPMQSPSRSSSRVSSSGSASRCWCCPPRASTASISAPFRRLPRLVRWPSGSPGRSSSSLSSSSADPFAVAGHAPAWAGLRVGLQGCNACCFLRKA